MAQFERTLELDPDYPKTHFLLGYVHMAEGKVEEAIASFERSVALSPDTPKYRDALEAAAANDREDRKPGLGRERGPGAVEKVPASRTFGLMRPGAGAILAGG